MPIDPEEVVRLSQEELEQRRGQSTAFIQGMVEEAGADGAVLGLSGGIDSTLTAFLAVEALGPDQVKGLILPGPASDDGNMADAETVAGGLAIPYETMRIDDAVAALLGTYPDVGGDRVATGNVQVRSRAVLTYMVANHENRVVLGTGNRTEALVGYFTKYGDQAVDCNPIGHLYKSQVRQLARRLDVPDRVVEKPPTAGMWPGQTDEDEIGMIYPVLDAVLALHVDGNVPKSRTAALLDVEPEQVDAVVEMHRESQHKRALPPAP